MLIDSHVHLQDHKFSRDLDGVLQRAKDAGIQKLVCIADDLPTSRKAVHLAARYPNLAATVGIHPHNERSFKPDSEAEIRRLAKSKGVVAIGEIGLDFHYPDFRKEAQIEVFTTQARIATELGLPMVIHCRDAYGDLAALFGREKKITARGVVHCFSGTLNDARALLDLGFYLGIGGAVTYPNATDLRGTIKSIGLDRVVCETDAPYLPPQTRRGRRNEPSYMKFTVAELARLMEMTYQDVARITTANAMKLYALAEPAEGEIAYSLRKRLYLNITNDCTNDCVYCSRAADYMLYGHYLKLEGEPSAGEILAAITEPERFEEFVICGLGEPTLRLEAVLEVARSLKAEGRRVRLNTNGHGNLIHRRDITPEFTGLLDSLAVTMNAHDHASYNKISRPLNDKESFEAMLDFTRRARKHVPDVRMKVIAMPGVDIESCRKIAEDDLKVRFQIYPHRPSGYPQSVCV